jgi:predicted nucleic acid-binding protein
VAIRLRRNHRVKLPDAIIAASALVFGTEMVTHDKALQGIVAAERSAKVAARSHPDATA